MSALRTAVILILAGGTTSALADQITCESGGERAEACGTVAAGSSVSLVRQLSSAPCVEGRNWGTGPDRDSIWVSGGCRAVFDVQPPYESTADNASDRSAEERSPEWQRGFNDGQRGTSDLRANSSDYRSGFEAGKDSGRESDSDSDSDSDAQTIADSDRNDAQNPSDNDRDDEAPSRDERADDSPRRYASADRPDANARRACIDQASAGESFGPEDVTINDVHWVGHGTFSVRLDTPEASLTCTVDRDGNVVSMDER